MKATLEFNLPEETEEFKMASCALNLVCVINEIEDYLREQIKHNDKITEEQLIVIEQVRDKLQDEIDYQGIRFLLKNFKG